jgi:hypothetical protein
MSHDGTCHPQTLTLAIAAFTKVMECGAAPPKRKPVTIAAVISPVPRNPKSIGFAPFCHKPSVQSLPDYPQEVLETWPVTN